jgi:hypothetical protein|tara:strand:+ start:1471 stop:1725 length:255 start_codon:yes stop_codon:yes gene_type:complete
MNKLTIWGAIFTILLVIILPLTYILFSMWWLISGDMVTRLTFFITGITSTISIMLIFLASSLATKINYRGKVSQIPQVKKLFKL